MQLLPSPFRFLKLEPLGSVAIFFSSVISGSVQSLAVLSLVPLMEFLGLAVSSDNRILSSFKALLALFGFTYSLPTVLMFMVTFISLSSFTLFFTRSYSAKISARLVRRSRYRAIDSILGAKWHYYSEKKTGSFVHTIITDSSKVSTGYMDSVNFFSAAAQGLVFVISIYLMSARVAAAGLFVGLLCIWIFRGWNEKARVAGTGMANLLSLVTVKITDGMRGIKPLKAMNRISLLAPFLHSITKELEIQQYRMFIVSAIPIVFREPILAIFMALGIFILVDQSLVDTASVIPIAVLFQRFGKEFGVTQGAFQSVKKMEPFLDSLEAAVLKANLDRENWSGRRAATIGQAICFKNVSFSYNDKVILNQINLRIPKGEFTAISGPSGSGKTTLADILCGLLTPDSGHIEVDGVDLSDIDIYGWRNLIGYVPQDLYLFHDTIASNINLGDPNIKPNIIENGLKAAGAWGFVSELPQGIDTNIGEHGTKLSGGQRQRLAIARALVGNAQLLILDEITSALDLEAAELVLENLHQLSKRGVTIIAVTHHPAVLKIADRAYRLTNGILVEEPGYI